MSGFKIHIFDTSAHLVKSLAESFSNAIEEAESSSVLNAALAGSNSPAPFYSELASRRYKDRIPWNKIHMFWGDERCVPPGHPDSNYGMVKERLLDKIAIPKDNIHRIAGEGDPDTEAMRYAGEIRRIVPLNRNLPQFDCVLLGMGDDGHTASIFPGSEMIKMRRQLCMVAIHPASGQKRITITLPVINNAKRIVFVVTGPAKAPVLAAVLGSKKRAVAVPAAQVKPVSGIVEWYLDKEAAALI